MKRGGRMDAGSNSSNNGTKPGGRSSSVRSILLSDIRLRA